MDAININQAIGLLLTLIIFINLRHINVVDENGKIIYAPSAEEYITKLRHSKKGIRWWDTKNSSQTSPIPYDEDALDYISSFYENVKRQPDKYKTLGTGLDV